MVSVALRRAPLEWSRRDVVRRLPAAVVVAAVLFALIYILFLAEKPPQVGNGGWRTTTGGSAVFDSPGTLLTTVLDGVTLAGWLFIVASGFALIFGLMRVVNMAHGAFYLLGGYIAYELQQTFANGGGQTLLSNQVSTWDWLLPALIAAGCMGIVGLGAQQTLLRWNQGQDLRQALITIAVSVIVADQIIGHFPRSVPPGAPRFGGNAVSMTWPGWTDRQVDFHFWGVQYSLTRLVIFGLGVIVGIALWLWLYRTRTGMVIRAGVDDRHMAAALGINIQVTFAIAFFVGSALAGFGGAVGAAQSSAAGNEDGKWLLYSLVVVIVGGMGSLFGAAAGAILFGLVFNFAGIYLPVNASQYSIVLTFLLIVLVLAFRPQGLFGRPG